MRATTRMRPLWPAIPMGTGMHIGYKCCQALPGPMGVPEEHKREAPRSVRFAVVVVSTSRYEALRAGREPPKDITGDLIERLLAQAGHEVIMRRVVPDDVDAIRRALQEALGAGAQAVIFAGGTGVSPDDVTIEAIRPLLDKDLPGFGELFRLLSYQRVGSAAMLTRALAGVCKGAAVFCIPGSPDAAELAVKELIGPEVGHVVKHARERKRS